MPFNPNKYKNIKNNRYSEYLKSLSFDTKNLETTVEEAVTNLAQKKSKSFVIYGEPQSGKTSMMIGLTAKLLDQGYKLIVILVQDNSNLLEQNFLRFQKSTLNPSPKIYLDVLPADVDIRERETVIFCKKNTQNLKLLIKKLDNIKNKVIIDDEADFASPNSKVNKVSEDGEQERTAINRRITDLLSTDGYYVGVTATPARIDVNRTFNNENHRWVYFQPHKNYKGQDFFFPPSSSYKLNFNLKLLTPDSHNPKKELKDAVIRFLVNVSYLNLFINKERKKNYIMLVHTNVRKLVHNDDRAVVEEVIKDLTTPEIEGKTNEKYIKLLELVYNEAYKKTKDESQSDLITDYVATNSNKNLLGVLNSEPNNKDNNLLLLSEEPANPFTFTIGGNIISRGLTFNNLLSMFFTRNVKGQMQQDTYIQRARMFGNRSDEDMKHFELTIPSDIWERWHTCFMLHRLAYISAKSNQHPYWPQGLKTRAVAPSSIDKSQVLIEKGEMSFNKIKYDKFMDEVILEFKDSGKPYLGLEKLINKFGDSFLPIHVINFIKEISSNPNTEIALHDTQFIESYDKKYADYEIISRPRGIFGARDYEKFPTARHHFVLMRNKKDNCRLFYNCRHGKISFISSRDSRIN